MEDTLRAMVVFVRLTRATGLNPCSNGRYSQSDKRTTCRNSIKVLILVLMEDTLRVGKEAHPIPYV